MRPFVPTSLPFKNLDYNKFADLTGEANRKVARYDGLLQSIVNPEVLLAPLRTKEAVLSSKIEGTQATLEEVLDFDAKLAGVPRKAADIDEVINYRHALLMGKHQMDRLPLSLNLIRRIHGVLMQGVRGQNAARGEFRRIQNWIGPPGSTQETATHVPPAAPEMLKALYNWEEYLHHQDIDVMVQLAIVHAQFEIIHPFVDGNGRIGRILIPLFLYHKEIIHDPVFYMSDYLESNRSDYYVALKRITQEGDWTNWVRFFLAGIIEQADKTTGQTRNIIDLYGKMKDKVVAETRSQFALPCLDFLFTSPIFTSKSFAEGSGVPTTSVNRMIKTLLISHIIECTIPAAGRAPAKYEFRPLLKIVNR
ncbi:Fic family protein [Neolewinella antarctica]|uniref:Fic family protein n=1 Tax=Neolewinella antarctica TaxID=442734 RepID=A0ABX0XET2_9BACT|nr:Fic/DOC family N-terminal domain-containing protein [Neolewinella antarctica]NJC27751.1 Fic family protein [Neolewinella antarctica]